MVCRRGAEFIVNAEGKKLNEKESENETDQVIWQHASSSFEEKSRALKGQKGEKPDFCSSAFFLCPSSCTPPPPIAPLRPPPFLIFPGTEVPACLAHDIDFHQRLEITSEPLPGQPASTFLHFLHTAAELPPTSFFFRHVGRS